MQVQTEIPDVERREALKSLLSDLRRSRAALPDDTGGVPDVVSAEVVTAKETITSQINTVRDELDDIQEWDESAVRELVLEAVGLPDTTHKRQDGEVVLLFDARGELGNETELRYAVEVTTGSEWFHVKVGDDWVQVWSN